MGGANYWPVENPVLHSCAFTGWYIFANFQKDVQPCGTHLWRQAWQRLYGACSSGRSGSSLEL